MNALAIDTSTGTAGVAAEIGGLRETITWRSDHNHGRELVPKILQCLRTLNGDIPDIDCVAVALGPGGFSAVRVGVACALGIAATRGLTTVGIPTHYLQAYAHCRKLRPDVDKCDQELTTDDDASESSPIATITSAIPIGRGQYSVAAYALPIGPITETAEHDIVDSEQILAWDPGVQGALCGEFASTLQLEVSAKHGVDPRPPEIMLDIAKDAIETGKADWWHISPIYAREPTITRRRTAG